MHEIAFAVAKSKNTANAYREFLTLFPSAPEEYYKLSIDFLIDSESKIVSQEYRKEIDSVECDCLKTIERYHAFLK